MTKNGQTTLIVIGSKRSELPKSILENPENLFWDHGLLNRASRVPEGMERVATTLQMPLAVRIALQSLPRDTATVLQILDEFEKLKEYLDSTKNLESNAPILLVVPSIQVLPREVENFLNDQKESIQLQTAERAKQSSQLPRACRTLLLFRIDDQETRAHLAKLAGDKQIKFQSFKNPAVLLDFLEECRKV